MKIQISCYQYLSRIIGTEQDLTRKLEVRNSPIERPDIVFSLRHTSVKEQFFGMNVPQLGRTSAAGAEQFFDHAASVYMNRKWPQCLILTGEVEFTESELNAELVVRMLIYIQGFLWDKTDFPIFPMPIPPDQRATIEGYRREHFDWQMPDLYGAPRPNSQGNYELAAIGDPIGPGLSYIHFKEFYRDDIPNEFGWSQILPFPGATNQQNDIRNIRKKVRSLNQHYNSYNELQDAHKHLEDATNKEDIPRIPPPRVLADKEIKAAIRAAASAIDAILRYYCDSWGVKFPSKNEIPFDEKIETVLKDANKPSFRQVDPSNSEAILFLYRSRNTMHEAACYYKDNTGKQIAVRTVARAMVLVEAAERFVCWIDSLA